MAVTYALVFKDHQTDFITAGCFGKLRDYVSAEAFEGLSKHGPLLAIRYRPEGTGSLAKQWYEYLLAHPLWSQALLGEQTVDSVCKEGVLVRADITPHFMLNTLSMYRHPSAFTPEVSLWREMVEAGANPDAAAYTCTFFRKELDGYTATKQEHSEHAVFCRRTATLDTLRNYVAGMEPPLGASYGKNKKGKKIEVSDVTFADAKHYVRDNKYGVACWLDGYSPMEDASTNPTALINNIGETDIEIVYDTEKKEVISATEVRLPIKDATALAAAVNKAAGL